MYNTGTNLLDALLKDYCIMPRSSISSNEWYTPSFVLPWGKHSPANIWEVMMDSLNETESTLPVVVIKDPFN